MRLRVWHIPQIPKPIFYVDVKDIHEAKKVISTLWSYDLFQSENNIKPDYSNSSGLEQLVDGEWIDWCDEDSGLCIDELI